MLIETDNWLGIKGVQGSSTLYSFADGSNVPAAAFTQSLQMANTRLGVNNTFAHNFATIQQGHIRGWQEG